MKALILLLLLLNIGFGLWEYSHTQAPIGAPPPLHANRLRLAVGNATATPLIPVAPAVKATNLKPTTLKALPALAQTLKAAAHQVSEGRLPAMKAPAPIKVPLQTPLKSVRRPVQPVSTCWQLGPVAKRDQAVQLMRRLHLTGRVLTVAGPPAYRVFLAATGPWPSAQVLAHLGVRGAYVTHGPTGGEVLSLGVFLEHDAAMRELRHLRKGHLAARIAPFGAPTHYYDKVHLTEVPAGFWHSLGSVGHHVCR